MDTRLNELEIFEATPEDLRMLVDIEEIVSRERYPNASLGVSTADIDSIGWGEARAAKYRERYLSSPYGKIWAARADGKIVGFCAAVKEDQANRIGKLYVLSPYQGRGIGSRLLDTAERWLGTNKEIWLGVATFDRDGLRFYTQQGYEARGSRLTEHTTIPATGTVIPETLMIKRF